MNNTPITPGAKATRMVHKMTIRFFSNGQVKVEGIPSNMEVALSMINDINRTVCTRFVNAAKQNQLSDQNVIDGGRIVVPQKGVH